MSIRLRLALWYGGLTGVVLVLVSLTVYAMHTRSHYDDLDRVMIGATDHLADEVVLAQSQQQVADAFRNEVAPDVVGRLYRGGGALVAASQNAGMAPEVDPRVVLSGPAKEPFDPVVGLAPHLVEVHGGDGVFGLASDAEGRRWRLYAREIEQQDMLLVTAAPLDRIDASVERFRWLVVVLPLAGTIVVLTASLLLAGRALRPVATLTRTAERIARLREFGSRVPVNNHKDELGQLALTFNEMLGSLEEAYRAQQRFVSDASHELRAPLTIIQANLEFLEHRNNLPESERREAIGDASREARRLANLVADLLALARADAGVEARRHPVELDRVLLDAVADARHLLRGQRLELGTLEPAMVDGDADQLKQLLIALLDNAVKYTPTGKGIRASLRHDDREAQIEISDQGVGIPDDQLPRVFDRFYRADPARSRDPGGTGLGLSIAQWIAHQHGGAIHLKSKVGRGTSAVVRLPVRRGE